MKPQMNIQTKPSDKQYAEDYRRGQLIERERVRAILSHPNAKHREKMALTLACSTDLSPEQAGKALSAVPLSLC